MCNQEVHTYVKMKMYQKQCYYITYTKLQAPFLRMADWWLRMPNTSERLLETPLPFYRLSEQHLTTH
jgi:hypothetical protein